MKPESKDPSMLRLIPVLLPNNNFEVQSELFIDHEGVLCIAPVKTNITWKDCIYQHIYLCSSLPIKEGDWVLGQANDESFNEVWKHDGTGYISEDDLKIEFTTDPKLITDGVPAIDGNTKANSINVYYPNDKPKNWFEVSFLEEYCKRYNHIADTGKMVSDKEVDVEGLADEQYKKYEPIESPKYVSEQAIFVMGFSGGYNQALQSNAGGFSLEDMKNFGIFINNYYGHHKEIVGIDKMFKEFQSIAKEQPKGNIVIECEMEVVCTYSDPHNIKPDIMQNRIKLNNGQPILIFK